MARKARIEYNPEENSVTFVILDGDGNPHPSVESVTFNGNDYGPAINTHAGVFGFGTKGQNGYAGIDEPQAIHDSLVAINASLLDNEWTQRGDGGGIRLTLLATDIMAATGKDQATVVAWLAGMSKADKKDVRDSDAVTESRLAREEKANAAERKAAKAKAKAAAESDDAPVDVFAGLGDTSSESDESDSDS